MLTYFSQFLLLFLQICIKIIILRIQATFNRSRIIFVATIIIHLAYFMFVVSNVLDSESEPKFLRYFELNLGVATGYYNLISSPVIRSIRIRVLLLPSSHISGVRTSYFTFTFATLVLSMRVLVLCDNPY